MRFKFIDQTSFYKGERVTYTKKKPRAVIEFGETGTVLEDYYASEGMISLVLVNWDKEGSCKYSLLGCPDHHGWAVAAKDLKKIL